MLKVGTSSDMEIIIQYTNKNEKQNKYHTIGTQSNINIVDRGKIYTPKSHGPFYSGVKFVPPEPISHKI
jgi:hypothetical protein